MSATSKIVQEAVKRGLVQLGASAASQPRNAHGRWTDAPGGGGGATETEKTKGQIYDTKHFAPGDMTTFGQVAGFTPDGTTVFTKQGKPLSNELATTTWKGHVEQFSGPKKAAVSQMGKDLKAGHNSVSVVSRHSPVLGRSDAMDTLAAHRAAVAHARSGVSINMAARYSSAEFRGKAELSKEHLEIARRSAGGKLLAKHPFA